jgi:hypothetical protein
MRENVYQPSVRRAEAGMSEQGLVEGVVTSEIATLVCIDQQMIPTNKNLIICTSCDKDEMMGYDRILVQLG